MSRSQSIVLVILALAAAMVFVFLAALGLAYLAGDFTLDTSAPVQLVATPPERVTTLCQSETRAYLDKIEPHLDEWHDSTEVAASTARIALSSVVQDMQRLRREAGDVAAPSCAQNASGLLISGMDEVIAGFLDFMGESGDVMVEGRLTAGTLQIASAREQLDGLAMGMPPPADPDDAGYAQCGRQTIDDAQELSGEILNTFGQAALAMDYSDFCQRVGDWARRVDTLKTVHSECPVPQNSHLQAAGIWLGMGHSDCAESTNGFASWCQRGPQTLTATDCSTQDVCQSALEQLNGFAFSITRAEVELDRYGAMH